jgi:phage-related protein
MLQGQRERLLAGILSGRFLCLTLVSLMKRYMNVKAVEFHPDALKTLRAFPVDVRQTIGKALFDLQQGASLTMPLSRPMPGLGSGAAELRARDAFGAFRVFYVAKVGASIVVFHAFTKKTEKTPPKEIKLAQRRLKEMTNETDRD